MALKDYSDNEAVRSRGQDLVSTPFSLFFFSPVLHRPQKKCHFADFLHKSTTGSTSTCVFFLYDIPSLCHNFSYTFDPKMHHPAMDS